MPKLELVLGDQLMNDLIAIALKRRISWEELALAALVDLVNSSDASPASGDVYEHYLGVALEKVKSLKSKTKFSLNGYHSDSVRLFTAEEWAAMNNQVGFSPNKFGRRFLQHVAHYKDLIVVADKAGDNKQRYIRV